MELLESKIRNATNCTHADILFSGLGIHTFDYTDTFYWENHKPVFEFYSSSVLCPETSRLIVPMIQHCQTPYYGYGAWSKCTKFDTSWGIDVKDAIGFIFELNQLQTRCISRWDANSNENQCNKIDTP